MSTLTEEDFFETESKVANPIGASIEAVLRESEAAQGELDQLDALRQGLQETIRDNNTKVLPGMLDELGTEVYKSTETGTEVKLETAVDSKLPKSVDDRNKMFDALRPLGVDEIMREEFIVAFSPDDERTPILRALLGLPTNGVLSNSVVDDIESFRLRHGLLEVPVEEKMGAHPSRLRAWLKEKISQGHGTTITDAKIWHGKHAKIAKKKEK